MAESLVLELSAGDIEVHKALKEVDEDILRRHDNCNSEDVKLGLDIAHLILSKKMNEIGHKVKRDTESSDV